MIKTLLQDGNWTVRTMTNDPYNVKSQKLRTLGVEVLPGRIDNTGNLRRLFAGAYGVFSVTDSWGK